MTEKSFVIFINFIINQCFLAHQLTTNTFFETVYNLFQNRLIEHHFFPIHTTSNISTCEKFTTFQNNTITTGIQYIYPKFLIEYLTGKDKNLYLRILFLRMSTDFYTYSRRTA